MSNTKKINNTLKNFKEKAIRDVVKGSKPQSKEEDVSKGELQIDKIGFKNKKQHKTRNTTDKIKEGKSMIIN